MCSSPNNVWSSSKFINWLIIYNRLSETVLNIELYRITAYETHWNQHEKKSLPVKTKTKQKTRFYDVAL